MKTEELWQAFKDKRPEAETYTEEDLSLWPDDDKDLILSKKKQAFTRPYFLYVVRGINPPNPGEFRILMDGEEALAVLETQAMQLTPFDQVGMAQIQLEGEGYEDIQTWQKDKLSLFRGALSEYGDFDLNSLVVLESFDLAYVPDASEE